MNNQNIGIEKIAYYLPENKITSDDLVKLHGYDKSFIEEKVGVKQLYLAKDKTTTDLAELALETLLRDREEIRDKIQLVVVCTQTPEFQLPQTASQLQDRCRLSNTVASFDISLGCSGFVYGMSVVESLIESHALEYGVLVTAEKYSSIIDENDKNTTCIFSDGSAATLFSRKGRLHPGKYKFGTDGKMYDSLIVKQENTGRESKKALYMNGRNIFNFTVGKIPQEIDAVCEMNNVDSIDHYVLHQASSFVISSIANKCPNEEKEKFVDYMSLFGNTTSSTIPIALCRLAESEVSLGRNIFVSGFGVGLSWASTILFNKGNFTNE